jgi:hypothetical protein
MFGVQLKEVANSAVYGALLVQQRSNCLGSMHFCVDQHAWPNWLDATADEARPQTSPTVAMHAYHWGQNALNNPAVSGLQNVARSLVGDGTYDLYAGEVPRASAIAQSYKRMTHAPQYMGLLGSAISLWVGGCATAGGVACAAVGAVLGATVDGAKSLLYGRDLASTPLRASWANQAATVGGALSAVVAVSVPVFWAPPSIPVSIAFASPWVALTAARLALVVARSGIFFVGAALGAAVGLGDAALRNVAGPIMGVQLPTSASA